MQGDASSIKELMAQAFHEFHLDDTLIRGQVEQAYRETVGELVTKLTYTVRYSPESHILYLRYASPALRQEMNYKITDLINAINTRLNRQEVQKIVVS